MWYPNPTQWTSKYGSITVNQWGREFPSRGMNEAGLAVGEMTLTSTRFPDPDLRTSVTLLQWIQYQLDNCATVDQVIESNSKIRIDPSEYHSHFLLADSNGNCVAMEWLNGELVYHAYENLPVQVLTNSTYEYLLENYLGSVEPPSGDNSLARFCRAASMLEKYDPSTSGSPLNYAFDVIQSVSQGSFTRWRLVFDIKGRCFYFRTNSNDNLRYVDLRSCDFSCSAPVRILDINAPLSGDVYQYFIDYDRDLNYTILSEGARKLAPYLGDTPDWVIDRMANYPESTLCNDVASIQPPDQKVNTVELYQDYPNPFNPSTRIRFGISGFGLVSLRVFDVLGREIKTLLKNELKPGRYETSFDGSELADGMYYYQLKAGDFISTRKLLLIR
jgi:choloylglycine hydrolase